jgi:hypothetical protein
VDEVAELLEMEAKAGVNVGELDDETVEVIEEVADGVGGRVDEVVEGGSEITERAGIRGELTGSLNKLDNDERAMVEELLSQGKDVEIIPRSNIQGDKTPDFEVNGVKTELKTLNGTSLNTPVTRIQDGFKQGALTVVLDGRKTGLTAEQAEVVLGRTNGIYKDGIPGKIEIWTVDGIIYGGN